MLYISVRCLICIRFIAWLYLDVFNIYILFMIRNDWYFFFVYANACTPYIIQYMVYIQIHTFNIRSIFIISIIIIILVIAVYAMHCTNLKSYSLFCLLQYYNLFFYTYIIFNVHIRSKTYKLIFSLWTWGSMLINTFCIVYVLIYTYIIIYYRSIQIYYHLYTNFFVVIIHHDIWKTCVSFIYCNVFVFDVCTNEVHLT